MRRALAISKLPGTDRYAEGSTRLKDLRGALQKGLRQIGKDKNAMVYVVRPTWAIDPESKKPVEEISAFVLSHEGELLQLSVDAWKDVLKGEGDHLHRVKVAYSPPYKFELPPNARELMADIDALGEGTKVVSFSFEDTTMNYDAFESSAPTTMHMDMRDMMLATRLRDGLRATALCIFDIADDRRPKVAAWDLSDTDKCTRLSPQECRRLVRGNAKGHVRPPSNVMFK